jgi:hypothetical protein
MMTLESLHLRTIGECTLTYVVSTSFLLAGLEEKDIRSFKEPGHCQQI